MSLGLLLGGVTGCVTGSAASMPATVSKRSIPDTRGTRAVPDQTSQPILVWTPGSLPSGFAVNVQQLPGVSHALTIVAGTVWLTRSRSASGTVVDHAPSGMGIPLDLAGAPVAKLRPFLPSRDGRWLAPLADGRALLSETSARLRRLGVGGVLEFANRRVVVAGIVPDADIGAHELLVSSKEAARLGVRTRSYLLVDPNPGISWRVLAARIRRTAPADVRLRIRGPGRAAYLRQADAVLPPVMMKSVFGEFAANPRPQAGGWITIDPAWVAEHIETVRVPILGEVTCNRALIPLLRGALRELARRGLASLVHVDQFAGCYAPRLIPGYPGQSVSHHAWGAALDLNSRTNPFGTTPHQDPRVVATFRKWGFTWGGRWLVPDGMHFEFLCPPSAIAHHRRSTLPGCQN
jgi:hypothetical protein